MNRHQLGALIASRLAAENARLQDEFAQPNRISSFVLDDLLPDGVARALFAAFPAPGEMMIKKSLREYKYVAAQMDRHDPCLEAIVYAFQEPEVVALIESITGISPLLPDSHLYAGGISAMPQSCFLNPHVDNSHDKDRQHYRVLNLLYYTTPDWPEAAGGNLELWDSGLKVPPRTIWSKFNRLVAMITHQTSWHSVSPIRQAGLRTCVSNYYFGPHPVGQADYFHVTSFRGRPEQPIRDLVLQADAGLRMGLRQLFPKGVRENPHVYKR